MNTKADHVMREQRLSCETMAMSDWKRWFDVPVGTHRRWKDPLGQASGGAGVTVCYRTFVVGNLLLEDGQVRSMTHHSEWMLA
jgi:hypothetical protein